jgi:hypothetical protein
MFPQKLGRTRLNKSPANYKTRSFLQIHRIVLLATAQILLTAKSRTLLTSTISDVELPQNAFCSGRGAQHNVLALTCGDEMVARCVMLLRRSLLLVSKSS